MEEEVAMLKRELEVQKNRFEALLKTHERQKHERRFRDKLKNELIRKVEAIRESMLEMEKKLKAVENELHRA
jgi:hypothetical protein